MIHLLDAFIGNQNTLIHSGPTVLSNHWPPGAAERQPDLAHRLLVTRHLITHHCLIPAAAPPRGPLSRRAAQE
jgi:hypothetical protein